MFDNLDKMMDKFDKDSLKIIGFQSLIKWMKKKNQDLFFGKVKRKLKMYRLKLLKYFAKTFN